MKHASYKTLGTSGLGLVTFSNSEIFYHTLNIVIMLTLLKLLHTTYILLHIRFPGEHDLGILLHFHGNVTVLLRNSEFVTFPW
jgi:hypothetical protein